MLQEKKDAKELEQVPRTARKKVKGLEANLKNGKKEPVLLGRKEKSQESSLPIFKELTQERGSVNFFSGMAAGRARRTKSWKLHRDGDLIRNERGLSVIVRM